MRFVVASIFSKTYRKFVIITGLCVLLMCLTFTRFIFKQDAQITEQKLVHTDVKILNLKIEKKIKTSELNLNKNALVYDFISKEKYYLNSTTLSPKLQKDHQVDLRRKMQHLRDQDLFQLQNLIADPQQSFENRQISLYLLGLCLPRSTSALGAVIKDHTDKSPNYRMLQFMALQILDQNSIAYPTEIAFELQSILNSPVEQKTRMFTHIALRGLQNKEPARLTNWIQNLGSQDQNGAL
jgi:hypothetical protein